LPVTVPKRRFTTRREMRFCCQVLRLTTYCQ
jgi:hypothetical protein